MPSMKDRKSPGGLSSPLSGRAQSPYKVRGGTIMPLQIVGAAFPRTGTVSLKLALEQLGFGPCHHMAEMIARPETGALWIAAAEGQADWDTIFANYKSCA